ncbi:MAG: hypothetical protein PHD48_11445 [Alphaproteobacteria bacterium]|nr:hypothetical protein [Alphaproteobacteria bacterium]
MAENRYKWLIELFDAQQALSLHDAVLMDKADWFRALCAEKALIHSGNLTSILCSQCDVPHTLKVNPLTYKAYCAEAGQVQYKPEDTMQYAASPDWIFKSLRTALSISGADKLQECVPGALWILGQTRIGKKSITAFFARNVAERQKDIVDYLQANIGKAAGILFLASDDLGTAKALPGGHRPVSLEVYLDDQFHFPQGALDRIWRGDAVDVPHVQHAPDFSTVTIGDTTHYFSGEDHRKVIAHLHKAWTSGKPVVIRSEMMVAIGLERTRQLPHLFKGHKTWRDLIAYGKPRGTCRLIIEEQHS